MNFPSSAFNRQYHIGNAQGIIQKPKQLAKLFHILDLPIDEVLLAEIQNKIKTQSGFYFVSAAV